MNNPSPTPSEASPLLQAIGLHKTYQMGKRSVEVLKGVSLDVKRGDFQALRGSSGAGKSTLLHLLAGLDTPDRGTVRFESQVLNELNPKALAQFRNLKVGFIFQSFYLLPELDALENVCLPARMARRDADATAQRARVLLERVGLSKRMDHRPYELSGGEQQRVAIARALINEPQLIIADEPTGNLDSHTGEEIMDLLMALRAEQNTTLLIATHDVRVAERAPRIIQFSDGLIQSNAGQGV